MPAIEEFISELRSFPFFEHRESADHYTMIKSVFEADGVWTASMLRHWMKHIEPLESRAVEQIGDEQIDKVFVQISLDLGDLLWDKWSAFIEREGLENETGLDNEMLDNVKRDLAWAYVEHLLETPGFFTSMLSVYHAGYLPCSWDEANEGGRLVVL